MNLSLFYLDQKVYLLNYELLRLNELKKFTIILISFLALGNINICEQQVHMHTTHTTHMYLI